MDYCADAILSFFGPTTKRVLFVPYAVRDYEAYAATVRGRFEQLGFKVDSLHDVSGGPIRAVDQAQAIFIGGGNTFRLLNTLCREQLLEPIRRHVMLGTPYLGSSAGSNVACPTIKTTNDMPIVQPPSFAALNLLPFQINPHYQDPIPGSMHMGETREERIREFHEENDTPVIGLREGAWLASDGATTTLHGATGARLFRRGQPPAELTAGSSIES